MTMDCKRSRCQQVRTLAENGLGGDILKVKGCPRWRAHKAGNSTPERREVVYKQRELGWVAARSEIGGDGSGYAGG